MQRRLGIGVDPIDDISDCERAEEGALRELNAA